MPSGSASRNGYGKGARLALVGVTVNFFLALIKIVAGLLGNAYALIADGIESTLDIFSSLIIWFGLKVAAEPPDDEHPYGHGKAEPLASIVVALIVIAAAIGLAVESVHEIITPHHAPAPYTLVVLIGVIIIKETLFRKVSGAAEELGSTAVKTDAWHHRADVLTSAGAFIGISIAIIGGKGWEPADDWAALFTCTIIAFNGYKLLMPALHEVMDTAPPKELESAVRAIAAGVPQVAEVEKCRVRKMGLDYYVDIHIGVDANLTVRTGHEISHAVKDAIRTAKPEVMDVLVHIEPSDVAEGAATARGS
ncbi:cation diffusion facilitator family transporter [Chthoniobacter flavus Ellin428]|uniref:Cation diffusion facilitator family transporter n=1 Tax=Chthoniobacter flavus Ellin428 TaxID=497964 RepID=B4CWH6_9BACT|nr:cation diffusion facilitator family transporter [Chthoniobacter flavus]EDY21768.1 cation diffusion facilitator family transporter [Chthoniobacter flavus Ellin428]TCO95700.1 cation diffusion facilitator family transporter [Chthoniobacter flavus]